MSEVQRYSIERYKEVSVEVVSEEDGDFVSYTDYIQLEHHKRELIILVSALEQQKAALLEYLKYLYTSQLIKSQRMTDILNKYK